MLAYTKRSLRTMVAQTPILLAAVDVRSAKANRNVKFYSMKFSKREAFAQSYRRPNNDVQKTMLPRRSYTEKNNELLERLDRILLTEDRFDRSSQFLQFYEELEGSDPKWIQVWRDLILNRIHSRKTGDSKELWNLLIQHSTSSQYIQHQKLWNQIIFTLYFSAHTLEFHNKAETPTLLRALSKLQGSTYVMKVTGGAVNGLVKLGALHEACHLVKHSLQAMKDRDRCHFEASVTGCLISKLMLKKMHIEGYSFLKFLYSVDNCTWTLFLPQPQMFHALFSSAKLVYKSPDIDESFKRSIPKWYIQQFLKTIPFLESLRWSDSGTPLSARNMISLFGAAIQCSVATSNFQLALVCFDQACQWKNHKLVPDENMYVNILSACMGLSDRDLFREYYRQMVFTNFARAAGFGTAVEYCRKSQNLEFLQEVLDDMMAFERSAQPSALSNGRWTLPLQIYNSALLCCANVRAYEVGRQLFDDMTMEGNLVPDSYTIQSLVANYRDLSLSDLFQHLRSVLKENIPLSKHVYTSMLDLCAQRQLVSEAVVIQEAMKSQEVRPDLKTYTALIFIYAIHGEIDRIIDTYRLILSDGLKLDHVLFWDMLDATLRVHGIDVCFALFHEFRKQNFEIPEEMYDAMIQVGLNAKVIERTLDLAYNMECEGIPLNLEKLYALGDACSSPKEAEHWIQVFLLLHQGAPVQNKRSYPKKMYNMAHQLASRFSLENFIPKLSLLASESI